LGDVKRVVAVTGTKREAAVLRGSGVEAIAIGGSSPALEGFMASEGASLAALISFGMAGALSPELRIGDWVIGEGVCGAVDADCEPKWREELARAMPNARLGICYADGHLIGDSTQKQSLHQKFGAIVADMESHLVAEVAGQLGVPFAILRCISDEAAHSLPPVIALAMRPDGSLALGSIAASLACNPAQLLELPQTIRAFNAAYSALRHGADMLTGRLAFDSR
jgi:adenosylhomocysteine nucleosidase